ADVQGLVYYNGMCGYCGKNRCHLYCGMVGQQKSNGTQYYPAMLRPSDPYNVKGCSHDDILLASVPSPASAQYSANLEQLVSSPSLAE
ncbi:hypothetical protein CONPUDRAFT_18703, partial [Coniophora puteana RWD-64-598 SS2]